MTASPRPRRLVDLRPSDEPAEPRPDESRTEVLPVVPARRPTPPRARPADDVDEDDADVPARRNGMGVPALVLGLLALGTAVPAAWMGSLLEGWAGVEVGGWAGAVLGVPAVVAGYLGARRAFHGLATDGASSLGGLVTGLVGLIVGAVIVWPTLFGSGAFGDGLTLDQCLASATSAKEMHMCKSQHLAEFNQRYPNAAE